MSRSNVTRVNLLITKLKNNRIISLIIVIGIIVISIGQFTDAIKSIKDFLKTNNEVQKQNLNNNKDPLPIDSTKLNIYSKSENKKIKKKFTVILILPAQMVGAKVYVDNKPAIILERHLTILKIQVIEKETNHTISAVKGNDKCSKQHFINKDNLKITLCD